VYPSALYTREIVGRVLSHPRKFRLDGYSTVTSNQNRRYKANAVEWFISIFCRIVFFS